MAQEAEEGQGDDGEMIIIKDWTGKTLAECDNSKRQEELERTCASFCGLSLRPSAMKTENVDDDEYVCHSDCVFNCLL